MMVVELPQLNTAIYYIVIISLKLDINVIDL
jgi:hypothetical protein